MFIAFVNRVGKTLLYVIWLIFGDSQIYSKKYVGRYPINF